MQKKLSQLPPIGRTLSLSAPSPLQRRVVSACTLKTEQRSEDASQAICIFLMSTSQNIALRPFTKSKLATQGFDLEAKNGLADVQLSPSGGSGTQQVCSEQVKPSAD